MGYKVTYNNELHVIQVVLSGEISLSDLNNTTQEYMKLSAEKNCCYVLLDATRQTESPSISELYNRPKVYHEQKINRATVVAYVMPHSQEVRQSGRFWETVCKNRGWQIQMFENAKDAEQYLVSIHIEDALK